MAVTAVNSTIAAFNTVTAITSNVATVDSDGGAEVFTITPKASGGKLLIMFKFSNLLATAAADANATFSIAAGEQWYGKAVTGTITKATDMMIQVETGKVMQDNGTVLVTLTPGADDKLKSNHAAAIVVYELL